MPLGWYRTIPHLDTSLNNPAADALTETQVTDPTHPLFGRRFPLLCRFCPGRGQSHVLVVYREGVYLRLPLACTDLAGSERPTPSKLTARAVTELVSLAEHYRLLCPSHPKPSGSTSAPNADEPSSMN